MSSEPFYEDSFFEDMFPWKEVSPEEYMAKHALGLGAFSTSHMNFKNKDMERWAHRLEEIFHDPVQIKAAEDKFLTPEEKAQQAEQLQKIMEDGL